MKTIQGLGLLLAATCLTVVGCAAAVPPQDLLNARSAYERASQGPAQQLAQADMHTAKTQLSEAEASFAKDGDTQDTRDAAYLAVRKTELAEVHGRTLASKQARRAS
jgi:hypothetical protein